jgi:hypothetical protein
MRRHGGGDARSSGVVRPRAECRFARLFDDFVDLCDGTQSYLAGETKQASPPG